MLFSAELALLSPRSLPADFVHCFKHFANAEKSAVTACREQECLSSFPDAFHVYVFVIKGNIIKNN